MRPDIAAPDCQVAPRQLLESLLQLRQFLEPYGSLFGGMAGYQHAQHYLEGRLQPLSRRTLEPIAREQGVPRRALQAFVGQGNWDDRSVRDQMRDDIAAQWGSPDGVLVLDGSSFPKCGTKSVGVQRQWCGRLGKQENCQVGEYLIYASPKGQTIVDTKLYLPESWANDKERREEAYVPQEIGFKKGWELAYEMVKEHSSYLPHQWIVGDDAYGRIFELRQQFAQDGERYLLEVPGHTLVGVGTESEGLQWKTVDQVAQGASAKQWTRVSIRDGEKGPIEVRALKMRVSTGRNREAERRETLLITEKKQTGERWFYLSNARGWTVSKMARVAGCRHYVEEVLELAKGDVGIDEYEVRSWVGWHHHMTLSMLALFFIVNERGRLKKRFLH
jgi:SRSO17 transposase